MDKIFVIRILLSFFLAGGWIAGSTLIAEKYGSRIGGLIGNLPSNILISLIFITIINSIGYLKSLIPGIPVGLSIDVIFIIGFIILLRYNLAIAISGSLTIWFCLAIFMQRLEFRNIYISITLYVLITILALIFLEKRAIRAEIHQNKNPTANQIIFRIVLGGTIVASIVALSRFCIPYFTGIFSTFPAMLLSTLIILTLNQGKEFAMATGKILVLSLSNILVYAVCVSILYPLLGLLIGTIIAYISSLLWVILLNPVARRMR